MGFNRRNVGWIVIGALLLLIGSFVAGSYYGYSQGYRDGFSEAQSDEKQTKDAPAQEEKGQGNSKESVDEKFADVITDEDLNQTRNSGSAETDKEGSPEASGDQESFSAESTESKDRGRQAESGSASLPAEGGGLEDGTLRESSESEKETDSRESPADESEDSSSEGRSESPSAMMDSAEPVFSIQILSVTDKEKAQGRVQELQSASYEATLATKNIEGKKWYRVRIGKFTNRQEAQSRADSLQEEEVIDDYWISRLSN